MMHEAIGNSRLSAAPPSTPIRLSGLRELPRTGDELLAVESEARAKEIVGFRLAKQQLTAHARFEATARTAAQLKAAEGDGAADGGKEKRSKDRKSRVKKANEAEAEDSEEDSEPAGPKLMPVVLKADSAGSLEALREAVGHFPNDRVLLKVVREALGSVTDHDVQFAETLGANGARIGLHALDACAPQSHTNGAPSAHTVVGFNVAVPGKVAQLADTANVGVHSHKVIYEVCIPSLSQKLAARVSPHADFYLLACAARGYGEASP